MKIRLVLLTVLVLVGKVVCGAEEGGDVIVGQWLTDEKDARIEIFKVDGKYSGKIVWVKDAVYARDDPEAGKPVHDRENPDPAKRDRSMIGLNLLDGFQYAGDKSWTKGTLYNPRNGKTYHANLTLSKDGALKVRGYVGVSLLGETTVWTRFEEPAKNESTSPSQGGTK